MDPNVPSSAFPSVTASTEVNKLKEAFRLFESEGVVEVEDFGVILRHLGLNPTQKQLAALKTEMAEPFVTFEKFEAVMSKIILTSTYDGVAMVVDSEDQLLKAFETLDPEKKGYIPTDKMINWLKTHGEPMNDEEINEFLRVAQAKDGPIIRYEDYVSLLCGSK
ncbi:hypothetical protein C9374_011589 [Naegleria lovaniensis]|uniref:EF-hand domain-containing protein n=1 Tax=Naegleria lovaniensis TaxID=51637 RepID=A0AA88KER8_NAELO|nr:uncharacterized protein C9374_011589 [Naegleria lovaniensis]KAG2373924.1 hypothetical protein C9374_011589 [Naegleria lovaniensis]